MNLNIEVSEALSAWNMGAPTRWSVAEQGEVNRNFVITTNQGRYVLRQILSRTHYRNSKDLDFECAYLDYLVSAGFRYHVPLPVPTKAGKLFAKIRGCYCWLYRFIEGAVVDRIDKSHFAEVARMMGTYHSLIEVSGLSSGKPVADLFGRVSLLKEIEGHRLEILKEHRMSQRDAIFMEESARLVPVLRSLDDTPYTNLKRYPIHRDIIPENLIWKNNKLVGIVDFEHVSGTNEPTVKDIAVTLQFTCRERRFKHQLGPQTRQTILGALQEMALLNRRRGSSDPRLDSLWFHRGLCVGILGVKERP